MAERELRWEYTAASTFSITLASLATSTTHLVGRQSAVITNDGALELYLDYGIGGFITVGTSPTADRTIEVWAFAGVNLAGATPEYPDTLAAADAARTLTSEAQKQAGLYPVASIPVPAGTSNIRYHFRPKSLLSIFGGFIPTDLGVFVAHDTGVNLNSTETNHEIYYGPMRLQSIDLP